VIPTKMDLSVEENSMLVSLTLKTLGDLTIVQMNVKPSIVLKNGSLMIVNVKDLKLVLILKTTLESN
jgi:hypothetical protein